MKVQELFETVLHDIELAKVSKEIAAKIYKLFHTDHVYDLLVNDFLLSKDATRHFLIRGSIPLKHFVKATKVTDSALKRVLQNTDLSVVAFSADNMLGGYSNRINRVSISHRLLNKKVDRPSLEQVVAHELRHALDSELADGRINNQAAVSSTAELNYDEYLKRQTEVNARLQEAMLYLFNVIQKQHMLFPKNQKQLNDKIDTFIKIALDKFDLNVFLDGDKRMKRIKSRLYKTVETLLSDPSITKETFLDKIKKIFL
jgi:hypothetical protein